MEEKYTAIRDIILRNIPDIGNFPTSIPGVRIVKHTHTTDFMKCFYDPSCILILQGVKHLFYGNEHIKYTKGQYVVSCTDIPVSSRVAKASIEDPFVVLILELNSSIISNLILETDLPKSITSLDNEEKSLAIADTDKDLLDSFYRLAGLLEKPEHEQKILSPIIIKEIYYRLLTGELGSQLRIINTKGTRPNQITEAISIIKERFNEKINMDELDEHVNMAPSSFYRNFKKITQVSPLQYQKQLKLYEAQRLMLTGNYDVTGASYEVGYESPTQFSREYKKMFGNPPKTDIKHLALA